MLKDLSQFLYILGNQRKKLPLLAFLFLLSSVLDTLGISLIGPFMGLATNPNILQNNLTLAQIYSASKLTTTTQFITLLGLATITIFCIKTYLSFFSFKYIYTFSHYHTALLREKLFHIYLTAPYTFFVESNTSVLIQNIMEETRQFCHGILIPLLTVFSNGFLIILLVLLLALTNWVATIAVFAITFFTFLFYVGFRKQLAYWGKNISEGGGAMIRTLSHSLGSIKETRVIGCEYYFEDEFKTLTRKMATSASSSITVSQLPRLILEASLMIFLVGFVLLSFLISEKSESLFATLSIFALAAIRLLPSTNQFIGAILALKHSSYSLKKLYLSLKSADKIGSLKEANLTSQLPLSISNDNLRNYHLNAVELETMLFQNSISIDHIQFQYPNTSHPTLQDISLKIRKGQSIAFIGKSGAGKTTIVDVLLGLLIPKAGDILVDNCSIYSNLRSWQNLIGYIPQTISLIDDSVERNIAFGVPDHLIDINKLSKAIELTQLQDFIFQLPKGVKTFVGERGIRLSGGQRQRIGIARAIYHEREILVLDEATSALDDETERLITDAIRVLSRSKTIIIIAHRLNTVKHCDRIYLLEQGKILKSGTYEEVVLKEETN